MTRIAAITPAHRNYLRQLKTDFDQAYAEIDDLSDRTSPRFRAAEALYRVWIKSIDAHAMALLDDLDAFDIGGGGRRPEPQQRQHISPVAPIGAGEVDHIFAEMEDVLHARDLIEDPNDAAITTPLDRYRAGPS